MKNAQLPEGKLSALVQRHSNAIADLFPETLPPTIPASWPSYGTRAWEALQALIVGPQNQADYQDGWRLAAYVQSLEYKGWQFICRLIEHPRGRKPIAEYRLDLSAPSVSAAMTKHGGISKGLRNMLSHGYPYPSAKGCFSTAFCLVAGVTGSHPKINHPPQNYGTTTVKMATGLYLHRPNLRLAGGANLRTMN